MLELVIDIKPRNELISKETNSGKWTIYVKSSGQKSAVEEKHFSSYEMEIELDNAVKALKEWNKRLGQK